MPTPTLTGTPVISVYGNPISVTAGSGGDILGVFGVRTTQSGTPAAVTSTWGADAMTALTQGTTGFRTSTLSYRVSPATGARNVTATTTDTVRGLIGATFQDVVSLGASGQANGSGTAPALNLGSIGASDAALIHIVWDNSTVTLDTPGGTLIASTSEDNHRSALILASSGSWAGVLSGSVGWAVSGLVLQGSGAAGLGFRPYYPKG